jgi:N-methylhydantoinase A
MGYRLGIDVGGTFTDLVLYDGDSGTLAVEKVPTVPADPSQGILDGVRKILAGAGIAPAAVDYLAHGTTVATNTLLQRNGARTALVTTRGFRDLLEIARQRRPSLYDLHAPKPAPLVPRALRREVTERVMADGTIRTVLDLDEVDRALDDLTGDGIEALAVCFLYSFLRPEHERAVVERARLRFPAVPISASHEVLPEFREYERLSTTVANAYLTPRMAAYVRAFRQRVENLGIRVAPYINQSNGGTISVEEAARAPVRTVLSGPSAGVAGAAWLATRAGLPSIATFDMGGTSTDVSFVEGGMPRLAFEREIAGVPLRVPALDIHTVGAGGGSIAWRDSGGALKVGPASAGADPGPVCYGRGGTEATVTDANLLLGRLSPLGLLGGAVPLDVDGARRSLASLGDALGLSPLDTAVGILTVVNANMAHAMRKVTVERGVDPARLALLAFGGAGPLHAAELARELGIPTVVVPPSPGLLCALGLLVEDLRMDLVRTWIALLEPAVLAPLGGVFTELEREATGWLDRERVPRGRRSLARMLDMRYAGQNYELLVPVPEETWRGGERSIEPLRRKFLESHETVYGFAAADEPIQIVNARLVARGVPEPPEIRREKAGSADPTEALRGERRIWVDAERGFVDAPVYDRARLRAGHRVSGPAILDQFDSTTVLLAGQRGEVDELGCVVITEDH